jgi:hypothetical protein
VTEFAKLPCRTQLFRLKMPSMNGINGAYVAIALCLVRAVLSRITGLKVRVSP